MPNFVFSYRNPKGYIPSPDSRAEWMSWFEGMGDHLLTLGQPVFERTTIGECDPASTELGGYSIIDAEDFESARAIAQGCPYLGRHGGVEIGLLHDVLANAPSVS